MLRCTTLKKTPTKHKSSFEDTISTTALTLNILHSRVTGDILHIMPQSYSAEILRLELQFIHCVFFTLGALMYCTVHFIQSFANFPFISGHPFTHKSQISKKLHRKNRSAGFKTFEAGHFHASEQPLGLDTSESSVSRGLLAPSSSQKAPL